MTASSHEKTIVPRSLESETPTAETTTACDHCGLDAPLNPTGPSFCCDGCRGAYAIIHEWELDEYYALRDQLGGRASKPESLDDSLMLLDDMSLLGDSVYEIDDGLCSVRLTVDGLHCGACAWLVERSVPLVPGWQSARVNMAKRSVEIVFSPTRTKLSQIGRTLSAFGYRIRPLTNVTSSTEDNDRSVRLRRLAVAAFCFMNAMWIAIGLYAGDNGSIAIGHASYLRFFGTALAAISVLGPGRVFLRSAWAAVRTRTPHIDLPVSVGLIAGLCGSIVAVVFGIGESYFDSLTGLVFFLLLGRELQTRMQHRASAALRALASLSPPLARLVIANGQTKIIRASDIEVDDVVEVLAQHLIPIDGEVIQGASHVDQSLLTGESVPVPVLNGSVVAAGARNLERTLHIRAAVTSGQTRVAGLTRLVEDSLSNRTPLVQQADRIGGVFVLVVLFASIATFLFAIATNTPLAAAQRAVALLVVACPCALALATPLAIGVAVGRAATNGLLIRNGDIFERLRKPGVVWFDKTGTLTEGTPAIIDWHGREDALALAAAIEVDSRHPVARCIVEAAESQGWDIPAATAVEHHQQGVSGSVDNDTIHVGSQDYVESLGVSIPPAQKLHADLSAAKGLAPNFVAINRVAVALFAVGDPIRNDARDAVNAFLSAGWTVGILSGDHRDVVEAVGSKLGVPRSRCYGGQTPEEKLAIVSKPDDQAKTIVFVGDGVNDAAALAAADVGIATSGAAEASLQAAAVYCSGPLADVAKLMPASKRTVAGIHALLGVSLAYNLIAGLLAIGGFVTPLVAAILMPVSSLIVTLLAFAAPSFETAPTTRSNTNTLYPTTSLAAKATT